MWLIINIFQWHQHQKKTIKIKKLISLKCLRGELEVKLEMYNMWDFRAIISNIFNQCAIKHFLIKGYLLNVKYEEL